MNTPKPLRIGTRGSDLALWQAHYLQDQLRELGVASELEIIKTQGDRIQHLSFDKLEGKGFFTKEIEDRLLEGAVDVAVHSMKDLPTQMPAGLVLAALSKRANPRDLLLVRPDAVDSNQAWNLRQNAQVGTSSARRKGLLLDLRPDLTTVDIRGNVPTRIQKLRDGQFDAIVLAAAGIERLELPLDDLEVAALHPSEFVPAPAQGVLAFQCRENDPETRRLMARLHHRATADCTNVERSLLRMFDGGCHLPLGAYCTYDGLRYQFSAAYAPELGQPLRRHQINYSTFDGLAEAMYEALISQSPD